MRVLVTGASRGIGRAIALRLARDVAQREEQAIVTIAGAEVGPDLANVAAEIEKAGARVLSVAGDLSDPDVPGRIVEQALDFCGGLDVLVSNAGITSPAPLASLARDQWDLLFAVNARAPWLLAQAAYPALRVSRGAYIAVASMSGLAPHAGHGAYSPSKAAVIMLCRQLAQEWACDGITVNAVCPGMIRTPLTETLYRDADVAARRKAIVPLGRVGTPEDVASVVSFVAGEDARYVTGEAIRIDGGFASSILSHVPGLPASRADP
jgi:NAD(P)-dependent dehydrogenase (short-subunit alcohol dehydrogenase family)